MIKIKTADFLREIDGKESENTVGDALALIIINAQAGGKMRLFKLARRFSTEDVVELDSADVAIIKQAIENTTVYSTALVPGQLLEMLEKTGKKAPESPYVDAEEEQGPEAGTQESKAKGKKKK